jgi:hypothetical protein
MLLSFAYLARRVRKCDLAANRQFRTADEFTHPTRFGGKPALVGFTELRWITIQDSPRQTRSSGAKESRARLGNGGRCQRLASSSDRRGPASSFPRSEPPRFPRRLWPSTSPLAPHPWPGCQSAPFRLRLRAPLSPPPLPQLVPTDGGRPHLRHERRRLRPNPADLRPRRRLRRRLVAG